MTKQELQAYQSLKRQAAQMEQIMTDARIRMLSLRSVNLERTGKASGNHDKIGAAVASYLELTQSYSEKLSQVAAGIARIEAAINTLPEQQKELMRSRYIIGKSWERIAADMGYSWRQTHRIHAAALQELKTY